MQTKTALITGASSGFGRAIARRLAAQKYQIIALARRKERLLELQQSLGESHCALVACDVQESETIAQSLAQIASERGWSIDVLVNNAGFALGLQSADCADLDDWERMISVNCMALVRLTRLVLPQMVARKSGTIINIGSIAGSYPYPGGNVYGATKAFVKQFSLNLRADLFDKNIRVTNIEPGLAQSEFSLVRFKGDKAQADSVYAGTKPLLPEDIAETVAWVLSLPEHVNINRIELMPTTQAAAALNVCRNQGT
ncbi:MAG: SDR family NAD(P)-dependent oxidoreductase [Helicobacter sp.]|nr:SDR family NAD(P)-dependent oxidoreductase [Helicobacter sp.]